MTPPVQPGQFPPQFTPQYPPPPAPGYNQPQQQFQQQPQAPPPPAAPPVPAQADLNARIPNGSPDWPQELWGKPVREALRYYNIMREDFRQRHVEGRNQPPLQGQPQPGQMPQQQQFQQQPRPQAPVPQQPLPQQPQQQFFDPAQIQTMLREAVRAEMAPMQAISSEQVLNRVRAKYADWHMYHQQVLEVMGPALAQDPSVGLNEESWETAYFLVRGRAQATNQVPQYTPQPHAPQYGSRGEIMTPPPPAPGSGYFAEGPTVAPPAGPSAASLTNDPRVVMMARKHGLPVEELALWWNGAVPAMNNGQR